MPFSEAPEVNREISAYFCVCVCHTKGSLLYTERSTVCTQREAWCVHREKHGVYTERSMVCDVTIPMYLKNSHDVVTDLPSADMQALTSSVLLHPYVWYVLVRWW